MNDVMVIGLEVAVLVAGLAVLLIDLWVVPEQKRLLGPAAAIMLGVIFLASFAVLVPEPRFAFGQMYVLDELALYFKRFFLLAAILVILMASEFAGQLEAGASEYYALTMFALAGMMFAASANDFSLLFVSLELVTVAFYVLVSFQRRRLPSLEAGAKYLILGALSSAFLVYGIAFVFGASGTMTFTQLAAAPASVQNSRLLELGLLLVLAGLGFKIAAVPFQVWAPDVYQGAPTPTTAFLAIGSKAAGMVLLLRVLFVAVPSVTLRWSGLLVGLAMATILYGVLCAIPQRSLKRLMGYSSIANAGYLLLGIATLSAGGVGALLYYLAGYLFAVAAVFLVVSLVGQGPEADAISALAGLHRRSPLLAATLAIAMVSLAGVPPMAGFFGKFLLIKSAVAHGGAVPGLYALVIVAVLGVVISLYYYFGVIRAIYWEEAGEGQEPVALTHPARWALCGCIAAMLWLGVFPNQVTTLAEVAARTLRFPAVAVVSPGHPETAGAPDPGLPAKGSGAHPDEGQPVAHPRRSS